MLGKFRADEDAWWNVVTPAVNALPKSEAYAYAILATEATLKLTDCTNDFRMNRIRDTIWVLNNDARLPAEMATRAKWLDEKRLELCFKPN